MAITPCYYGDQVMYIHSAEVGFSRDVQSDNLGWKCPALNNIKCTRSATNHSAIMNCHGKRSCRIPQVIFNYPVCDGHQNGTSIFIKITYDCVNPGKMTHVLVNVGLYVSFQRGMIIYICAADR